MKRFTKPIVLLILVLIFIAAAYEAYQYQDRWIDYLITPQKVTEKPEELPPGLVPPTEGEKPSEQAKPEYQGRILFLGDSLIHRWDIPDQIGGCSTINAGIDGNTTAAMVLRFQEDVVDRNPDKVFILGGINDILIAFQYDLITLDLHMEKTAENIRLMTKMAKKAGIEPVLCSVLPVASVFIYTPDEINPTIKQLNSSINKIAAQERVDYLDLWPYLLDPETKMLKDVYATPDGIHLSARGYFELLNGVTEYMNKHPVKPKESTQVED